MRKRIPILQAHRSPVAGTLFHDHQFLDNDIPRQLRDLGGRRLAVACPAREARCRCGTSERAVVSVALDRTLRVFDDKVLGTGRGSPVASDLRCVNAGQTPSPYDLRKGGAMRVREVCTLEVVTCTPEASAAQLAGLMRERHVGAVVVVARQANGDAPVRVVTDRDLAIDVMANGRDSFSVRASDAMSGSCASVLDTDLAYTAIWEMRRNSVRRLPVADGNGALVGIVTMDDLTRFLAQELSDTAAIAQHQLVVESSRHSR